MNCLSKPKSDREDRSSKSGKKNTKNSKALQSKSKSGRVRKNETVPNSDVTVANYEEKLKKIQEEKQAALKQTEQFRQQVEEQILKYTVLQKQNEKNTDAFKEIIKIKDVEIAELREKLQQKKNEFSAEIANDTVASRPDSFQSKNKNDILEQLLKERTDKLEMYVAENENLKQQLSAQDKDVQFYKDQVMKMKQAEEVQIKRQHSLRYKSRNEPDEQQMLEASKDVEQPTEENLQKIQEILEETKKLEQEVLAFRGNSDDKEFLHLDEMLTRTMIKLDNVDSCGSADIRSNRKDALQYVQRVMKTLKENAEKVL